METEPDLPVKRVNGRMLQPGEQFCWQTDTPANKQKRSDAGTRGETASRSAGYLA
jgi:hypothetical protein